MERLPQTMAETAERHKELLERLRQLDDADPEVARLRDQARAAVERGDYDGADRLLREAEAEDLAAERRMQERVERRRLTRAETLAQRAGLAELRFRYPEAARLYREAADLMPDSRPLGAKRSISTTLPARCGGEGDTPKRGGRWHRRALAIRERVLGPGHPEVATSTNNLAEHACGLLGRPAEAEPLFPPRAGPP